VFLHPIRSAAHVVSPDAFGPRNIDTQCFMLGWAWSGSNKKCVGSRYAELMFLHTVRFVCHIVRSGASVAQNVNIFFSSLGGPSADPRKMCDMTLYGTHFTKLVFLHPHDLRLT
jgi:hypothetical protein